MDHPLLAGFPVTVRIPIQWGDMDAYGHVNNTVYFRLFETARIAYLERCGFIESYERDKIGAILRSTECQFRLPLGYPDEVLAGARTIDVQADRFTMAYLIVSLGQDAVAGQGAGVIVSYDYTTKGKIPLPDTVRAGIQSLEGMHEH